MNFFSSKFAARGTQRDISRQLERIADCLEAFMLEQYDVHMKAPKADTSGPEPEALYVDEEADALQEIRERYSMRGPELEETEGAPV